MKKGNLIYSCTVFTLEILNVNNSIKLISDQVNRGLIEAKKISCQHLLKV